MPLTLDRLTFATRATTQAAVARSIGVSPSTVSKWVRGVTNIPRTAYKSIRNVYQKSAYNTLRGVGAPSAHARKFSAYAPGSVDLKLVEYSNLHAQYTAGAFSSLAIDTDAILNQDYINRLWDDMSEQILEGMRKSQKSPEEWQEYKFAGF